jgi:CheY-like chemotaxis protein
MEHILITAEYEVDATGTETGARELLAGGSYDHVLADAKLPDGTGLTVADQGRENGTKALVITGYAFMLPHGAFDRYDILLKPLRPPGLRDVVARHLGTLPDSAAAGS